MQRLETTTTEEEASELRKAAKKASLSLAAFLRWAALKAARE